MIPEAIAPVPPSQAEMRAESMRRIQIGLAGVFAVMLLVGLAGLIGDRAREKAEADVAAQVPGKLPAGTAKGSVGALEELGVQPVTTDPQTTVATKAEPEVAPVKKATAVPDLEPDPVLQRAQGKTGQ